MTSGSQANLENEILDIIEPHLKRKAPKDVIAKEVIRSVQQAYANELADRIRFALSPDSLFWTHE